MVKCLKRLIDINIVPTPDAVDDPFTTNEDTPVNVSPLGNDDDGAGVASVTVDTIPDPTEGVLTYTDDAWCCSNGDGW